RRNPFGVVRGRVQDEESGGPVTTAHVRVLGQETWTACDSLWGTYRLENVPEGNVVLEYEARGYSHLTTEVLITAGHETLHEATLERTTDYYVGKITGTIRDAITGAPLAATIQIAGSEDKTIPLDATGSFDLQLKGGKYPVTIKSE